MAIYFFFDYDLTSKYRQSTRRIGRCFKVPGLVRRTTCSRMGWNWSRKSCGTEFAARLQRSGSGWNSNFFLNFFRVLSSNECFVDIIQVRDQMAADGVKPFDDWIPQTHLPVESLPCSTESVGIIKNAWKYLGVLAVVSSHLSKRIAST